MHSIVVACRCGKRIRVSAEHAGRTAKCPSCRGPIQIPNDVGHAVPGEADPPQRFARSESESKESRRVSKAVSSDACPKCGFSYAWNGTTCAHCHDRVPDPRSANDKELAGALRAILSRRISGQRLAAAAGAFLAGVILFFINVKTSPLLSIVMLLVSVGIAFWRLVGAFVFTDDPPAAPSAAKSRNGETIRASARTSTASHRPALEKTAPRKLVAPDSIGLSCPRCKARLQVGEAAIGRLVKCQQCDLEFRAERPGLSAVVSSRAASTEWGRGVISQLFEGIHPQRGGVKVAAAFGMLAGLLPWVPFIGNVVPIPMLEVPFIAHAEAAFGGWLTILLFLAAMIVTFRGERHTPIRGQERLAVLMTAGAALAIAAFNLVFSENLKNYAYSRNFVLFSWRLPQPPYGIGVFLSLLSGAAAIAAVVALDRSQQSGSAPDSGQPIPTIVRKGRLGHALTAFLYMATFAVFVWQWLWLDFRFISSAIWAFVNLGVTFAVIDGRRSMNLVRARDLPVETLIGRVIWSWAIALSRGVAILASSFAAIMLIVSTASSFRHPHPSLVDFISTALLLLACVFCSPVAIWLSVHAIPRWYRRMIAGLSRRDTAFGLVWMKIFAHPPLLPFGNRGARSSGEADAAQGDGAWMAAVPYVVVSAILLVRIGFGIWSATDS